MAVDLAQFIRQSDVVTHCGLTVGDLQGMCGDNQKLVIDVLEANSKIITSSLWYYNKRKGDWIRFLFILL